MELIDKNKIDFTTIEPYECASVEMKVAFKEDIEWLSEIKAIPLDKVKKARNEIENLTPWDEGTVEMYDVLEILDKLIESDKIEWLYKEYESPVLSDDELELIKAISKATNKKYKYLAKQKGKIYLFTNKPLVHHDTFGNSYTSDNYFAYISDKNETLFQNIENEIGIYDIENKIFI